MESFEILCILVAFLFFLYSYTTANNNFWKIRGVPGPKPTPLFGNCKDFILDKISIGDQATKIYNEFKKEPMIGIFQGRTPVLILKDSELIKAVLIKDFNTFVDRGNIEVNEKVDPLFCNLFHVEPKRWRPLRKNFTPAFSSVRIKEMFHLLCECSDQLREHLEKLVSVNERIECRELTAKYTIDVIGSCGFGIDMNSLSNQGNVFYRMGDKIFDVKYWRALKNKIRDFTPWLFNLLGPFMIETEMNNFFINFIRDAIQYRRENNIVRHDFIDTLKYMKENPDKLGDIELTDTLIAAQAFVFFGAGFETAATTMSNFLYEVALNPPIQNKLRKEIQEELKETNGELIYDRIKNMKYLHKVLQETLRKYPPVTVLTRKSTEKYTFPGTKVTVPKGQTIWIPTYAIQRDPENYPEPEIFEPERFREEEEKLRDPMLFLSFGDGPRNCVGARFAVYQTKVGLIRILENYNLEVCDGTPIPYVNNKSSFLLRPEGGIYLKFSRVN